MNTAPANDASSIGWGIVGTGTIARLFAQAIAQSGDGKLVAVASREAERARQVAAELGDAQGVTYAEMLALDAVEVVYISTPNHRHKDDCLAAIAAGKSVLCEKPLATSAQDAREIAQAAQAAGVFCMEGMWTHFIPAVVAAEAAMRDSAFGEIVGFSASFGVPAPADPDGRLFSPALGGGALLDRGCYTIALALRFLGPVADVQAFATPTPTGVDASTVALLRHAGGGLSQISVSIEGLMANEVVVSGTQGRLRLHEPLTRPGAYTRNLFKASMAHKSSRAGGLGQTLRHHPLALRAKALLQKGTRWIPYEGNGYVHEVREVHACVRGGRIESAVVPLAHSIEILDVMDRIARASAGTD